MTEKEKAEIILLRLHEIGDLLYSKRLDGYDHAMRWKLFDEQNLLTSRLATLTNPKPTSEEEHE